MTNISAETYAAALVAASNLKLELERLLLGQVTPACRGSLNPVMKKECKVVAVIPAGLDEQYRDHVGLWYMWMVEMAPTDGEEGSTYSQSIPSYMISNRILRKMFINHFQGLGVRVSS